MRIKKHAKTWLPNPSTQVWHNTPGMSDTDVTFDALDLSNPVNSDRRTRTTMVNHSISMNRLRVDDDWMFLWIGVAVVELNSSTTARQ
jgi:hypothetical protein